MNRMKLGPLAGLADSDSETQKHTQSNLNPTDLEPDNEFWSAQSQMDIAFDALESGNPGKGSDVRFSKPEFSFFLPTRYESGHSYPLIIWLHSTGSDSKQLNSVMPRISDRNYIGASISGTERLIPESQTSGAGGPGYGWLQSADAIEFTTCQIAGLLEDVNRRFNIDRRRVFIGGRDSGGTMAYRIAFENPDWFSGVASVNGSLPANLNPLSNWRTCRRLPVFWAHGRRSVDFPESNLCRQLRLLHVAGFDVTLRQYPCADEFPNQVYSDMDQWMMNELARSGANIIG